jgi:hypothetical protein
VHPRNLKLGTPQRLRPTPAEFMRFLAFVELDADAGCWLWTGNCCKKGYGRFWWRGRQHWAHRWSRQSFRGKFKSGIQADHRRKCPRNCVNPDHLKPSKMMDHCSKKGYAGDGIPPF